MAQERQLESGNAAGPESAVPFISIVIPCLNSAATLLGCLQSIFRQDYPKDRIEVLLCDNGSTDGGPELAQKAYPGLQLIRARPQGSGYARNAGFRAAKGDLVLSTDADCIAETSWARFLVGAMQRAPDKTAAIGGLILPVFRRTVVEKYERTWVRQAEKGAPWQARFVATPNACYRALAVEQVGGFDGGAGHDDSDLAMRLQLAGYELEFTTSAIVRHRNPITLREMYEHRRKYGERNFMLACKHPTALGDPTGAGRRRQLLGETAMRVAKDIVKLPLSLVWRPNGRSVGWPAVDLALALANYRGFAQASVRFEDGIASPAGTTKVGYKGDRVSVQNGDQG